MSIAPDGRRDWAIGTTATTPPASITADRSCCRIAGAFRAPDSWTRAVAYITRRLVGRFVCCARPTVTLGCARSGDSVGRHLEGRMQLRRLLFSGAFISLLLLPAAARAQDASVIGTVSDETKAV